MNSAGNDATHKSLLKGALLALDEMQAKLDAAGRARHAPIAVVGMGCRFPGGANDPDAYWQLLLNSVDAVRELPPDRFSADLSADSGESVSWYGGFLDGIDQFDPHFFGISPREAASMDPQQRLVLEVGWEALEAAGQAPDQLVGSQTGVFLGITTNDYGLMLRQGGPEFMDAYAATGSALNAAAGRLAFTLGLQGPTLAVDTACSSSLVAVHLACQSLRNGECDMALAGGVNATLTAEAFLCFSRWGMMAPDGRCKTFDAEANGFVRGEGCGMIVLKRLDDALANNDRILAVIRGSAVNQDGRSSGLTVPNGPAQQAVLRRALADAGVQPSEISYVETHGTGTALGDPIEVEALGAVLGEGRSVDQSLIIGSAKTNLGHLESAAGVAGLIKLILSLQHETIPPHLHFQQRNPRIPWPAFPVEIPTQPTAWRRGAARRVAGVSAFGFSGTNAHLVIEEAPLPTRTAGQTEAAERPLHILAASAPTAAGLSALAARYAGHLAKHADLPTADIAYTINTGRAQFGHRFAVTGANTAALQAQLMAVAEDRRGEGIRRGVVGRSDRPRVAFLFTGQGAQYVGMGCGLYATQPTFRRALDECAALLDAHLDRPLLSVMFGDGADGSLLDETTYTQPALFAIEYALSKLWQSWGIRPGAVLGHSIGEYAAAVLAGVMSLADAAHLVAARGRLMGSLPRGGAMAAVFATPERVAEALAPYTGRVAMAACNGPEHVVISGDAAGVSAILADLTDQEIENRPLTVSHAFHSPLMEPILSEFERIAGEVSLHKPQLRLISNLSGEEAGPEITTAHYWRSHIAEPVAFAQGIATLHRLGFRHFIEIGPHPVLLGMGRRCLPGEDASLHWLPSLRQGHDDWEPLLDSLGALYSQGFAVDWQGFDADYTRSRVSMPAYPFQRQRYWLDSLMPAAGPAATSRRGSRQLHPFLAEQVDVAFAPGTRMWKGEISLARFPYLADHKVQGVPVVPATAYLEMVVAAAQLAFGQGPLVIADVENRKVLVLGSEDVYEIQVVLSSVAGEQAEFAVYSRIQRPDGTGAANPTWVEHVTGRVRRGEAAAADLFLADDVRRRLASAAVSGADFYAGQAEKGNGWGTAFQGIEQLWQGEGEALSLVHPHSSVAEQMGDYWLHPALSDSSGHVLIGTLPLSVEEGAKQGALVGGGIEEMRFYRRPQGALLWSYARLRSDGEQPDNVLYGDVQVYDETGALVAETVGARLWYLDKDSQAQLVESLDDWLYTLQWQPLAAENAALPLVSGADSAERWLIYSDRQGVGEALIRQLDAAGHSYVRVVAGPDYSKLAEGLYSLRVESAEDVISLLADATQRGEQPFGRVIHLWSLDDSAGQATETVNDMGAAAAHGLVSALHLVQGLTKMQGDSPGRLWLVTRNAQPAGEWNVQALAVAQSPLWGFGRTLAVEHPELWGGILDLDPDAPPHESAHALWDVVRDGLDEDQVAVRGAQRFVPRLARRAAHAAYAIDDTMQIHSDRAYLVSGGLGGLGLEIARWFVSRGARHLILLGRTPLPARDLWQTLEAGTPAARQVAAVQQMEAQGAQVHLAPVDVADYEALRLLLAGLAQGGCPPVAGVVHAAGVMQYQPLGSQDAAELRRLLRAKVDGGWALHRLFAGETLDFFVLFSSASTLLPSPLIAGYVAANTFLDALAFHRRSLGLPATSIDWGFWAQVGMVADFAAEERNAGRREGGPRAMRTIAPARGVAAFAACLAMDDPQVGVFPIDWAEWQAQYPALASIPLLSNFATRAAAGDRTAVQITRAALAAAADGDRSELLGQYLADVVAHVLRVPADELNLGEPLTYLGLDSLMALEIKNRIDSDLQITIPMIQLLQGPSVFDLRGLLLGKLSEAGPVAAVSQPAQDLDGLLAGQDATDVLAQLDEMSEENIDQLLQQLLAEEGFTG